MQCADIKRWLENDQFAESTTSQRADIYIHIKQCQACTDLVKTFMPKDGVVRVPPNVVKQAMADSSNPEFRKKVDAALMKTRRCKVVEVAKDQVSIVTEIGQGLTLKGEYAGNNRPFKVGEELFICEYKGTLFLINHNYPDILALGRKGVDDAIAGAVAKQECLSCHGKMDNPSGFCVACVIHNSDCRLK